MAPAMSKRDRGAPAGGGGKGGADSDEETPLVAAGKAQSTVVTIEERAPAENDPKHPMWVVIRAWPAAGWGLAAGGGRGQRRSGRRASRREQHKRAAQQAPLRATAAARRPSTHALRHLAIARLHTHTTPQCTTRSRPARC